MRCGKDEAEAAGKICPGCRHEDTWDTRPRGAVSWVRSLHVARRLPDRLQPSVNMHQLQSTTQPQA